MPLVLSGEGHFSLSGVKEVKVTEDFVGLGEEITHCQTGQFRADCLTEKHLARALETCHCAPLNIISHYDDSQVDKKVRTAEKTARKVRLGGWVVYAILYRQLQIEIVSRLEIF